MGREFGEVREDLKCAGVGVGEGISDVATACCTKLCGRDEEDVGGECECGDKEVLVLPLPPLLERNFNDGAKSSPRLSKSIPSLITIVPPACSACSKLISMREVRHGAR